ncbi:MAG: hypothetical protein KC502_12080 [Myxococcales bacterium]|nr:hypothetical protein [Myxococcales bacterium]
MNSALTLIGGCAVCAANDTDYGWFILSGTVLLAAMGVASFFAWKDGQTRRVLPMHIED